MIDAFWDGTAWLVAAAALGGCVNAMVGDNRFLFPIRVATDAHGQVIRPGLLACGLVSSLVGGGLSTMLTTVVCAGAAQPGALALSALAAGILGWLVSRCLTSDADKRLLRLAVLKASMAPAAHPDTVKAIRLSTPHSVLRLAQSLEVRFPQVSVSQDHVDR